MSSVKAFYNKFWMKEREKFGSYIRNISLPDLFHKGESVLDVGCGDGVVAYPLF